MKIVIIDYGAGNVKSVYNTLCRNGFEAKITDDIDTIRGADKVIFPGVGNISFVMQKLTEKKLDKLIPTLTQPVLGICVGMQVFCAFSEENDTTCLSLIDEKVKKFDPQNTNLPVPQIGWNKLHISSESPLFNSIADNNYVYFVHSYYMPTNQYQLATTNYIHDYCCAVKINNFYGVQFHPEKSGDIGETILLNFIQKI